MRIVLFRSKWFPGVDFHRKSALNTVVSGVIFAVGIPFLPKWVAIPHFCLPYKLTGYHIPGCGMADALVLSMRGHFEQAFAANPAILAFWIGYVVCFIAALVQIFTRHHYLRLLSWTANLTTLGCLIYVWGNRSFP